MLGGLFTRHRQAGPPPPPPRVLEPPSIPSLERRQEKERKWIESISHRSKSGSKSSSHPRLPAPVEFIAVKKESNDTAGLLNGWSKAPHKRGITSNTTNTPTGDHRSLRTTRSASALASKLGDSLKSTIGRSSRQSKESSNRERQSSSSSSLLSDCTAIPPSTATAIPRTPPLLQLNGDGGEHAAATFVHVPQLSPSSALLIPSARNNPTHSTLSYYDSSIHSPASSRIPGSVLYASHTALSPASTLRTPSTATPQSRISHLETTKSLAARLQELEHANNVGLLDDEEYRVLRQNLFEKSVGGMDSRLQGSHCGIASAATGSVSSRPISVIHPDAGLSSGARTGSLLGLPRLNMAESDTRASEPTRVPSQAVEAAPAYLPIPSNTSVHSKSRFSLRSSRSNLTTLSAVSSMSRRLFRRGVSAPAVPSASHESEDLPISLSEEQEIPPLPISAAARIAASSSVSRVGDNDSVMSMPSSLTKKLGKKKSIPNDWKELQSLHLKEIQREEAKQATRRTSTLHRIGLPGDIDRGGIQSMYVNGEEEKEEVAITPESGYRTMRRASVNPISTQDHTASLRLSTSSRNKIEQSATEMTKSNSDPTVATYLRSGSIDSATNSETADLRIQGSCHRMPRASMSQLGTDTSQPYAANLSTSALIVVQPGDEALDSHGLRQTIDSMKAEQGSLLRQFEDLERSLYEKYGDPASSIRQSTSTSPSSSARHDRRRESLSMSYLEAGSTRRMSVSSSIFSASQGRNSFLSHSGGSHLPVSSLSRRPSKASSIASSSMRRGFGSGSTQPGSYDTIATSRPPSTVQEEILFTALEAELTKDELIHPSKSSIQDPHYHRELQLLKERKRNIEERYTARLEYLEARLKGQLQKEKLRR